MYICIRTSEKYDVVSKFPTPSIDLYEVFKLKNNRVKFHPAPISNDEALRSDHK